MLLRLVAAVGVAAALSSVGSHASPSKHHAHSRHPAAQEAAFPVRVDLPSVLAELRRPRVQSDADAIIQAFVDGPYTGVTYDRLANFTDTIGPRVCGSATLETAVDYMIEQLQADGLDNVHAEQTSLPYWYRGEESATLIRPRNAKLNMLGLGGSVGTQQYGEEGLTADVIVVSSFDDLTAKAAQAAGKIVLFNQYCDWVANPVECYGPSVMYRELGAQAVAAVGGLAALVRTVGSFSINSPHTGMFGGYGNGTQIPTACLTIEDTDVSRTKKAARSPCTISSLTTFVLFCSRPPLQMLQRMQDRGSPITITLKMEAELSPSPAIGHNVVAEITGSEFPDEVVLVSGHLDSSVAQRKNACSPCTIYSLAGTRDAHHLCAVLFSSASADGTSDTARWMTAAER
jgi:carboxypeptidase Q